MAKLFKSIPELIELLEMRGAHTNDATATILMREGYYAVVNGYLKNVPIEAISEFEKRLSEYLDTRYEDVLTAIRTTGKLEDTTEGRLKEALAELLADMGF